MRVKSDAERRYTTKKCESQRKRRVKKKNESEITDSEDDGQHQDFELMFNLPQIIKICEIMQRIANNGQTQKFKADILLDKLPFISTKK